MPHFSSSKGALLASVVLLALPFVTAPAFAAEQAAVAEPAGPAAANAVPAERTLRLLPRAATAPAAPFPGRGPAPRGASAVSGSGAAVARETAQSGRTDDGIVAHNYGIGNLTTIYHYTDRLVDPELDDDEPWRWAGRFTFVDADGYPGYCSGALIARSILVLAGHCVHQGGDLPERGRAKGWIRSGIYAPAFRQNRTPYGTAPAVRFFTTDGWYGSGELDAGHDVGLVVLGKRTGTAREIGVDTGHFGFCHTDCLKPYWHVTQLGYPFNYAAGQQMAQGEHLARSDGRDFIMGSGMQGGSSGGPHVANLGPLADSSFSAGIFAQRNWIFAVTSWGYAGEQIKLQGASSLSGPGNANGFKALFNRACQEARRLHGAASCNLL